MRACEKRWLLERTRGTPRTYVLGNFQPSLRDFSFGSDLTQDLRPGLLSAVPSGLVTTRRDHWLGNRGRPGGGANAFEENHFRPRYALANLGHPSKTMDRS